jgi:hypothetical protein
MSAEIIASFHDAIAGESAHFLPATRRKLQPGALVCGAGPSVRRRTTLLDSRAIASLFDHFAAFCCACIF